MHSTSAWHYRSDFPSPLWNQRFTLALACLTAIVMSFTFFFAYNSSLEHPLSAGLIFQRPERSILVLNIASQLTIFCIAELTASTFEAFRWALASSVSGISASTFLALSRATNTAGVVFLLFGKGKRGLERDDFRLWGSQRYSQIFGTKKEYYLYYCEESSAFFCSPISHSYLRTPVSINFRLCKRESVH
jgi:hypothetical protein